MLTPDEINGMLVNQLKEELKARGASVVGKKNELCARLLELVSAEPGSSDAAPAQTGDSDVPVAETSPTEEKREEKESSSAEVVQVEEKVKNTDESASGAATATADAKEEDDNETTMIGSTSSQADTSVGAVVDEAATASVEDAGSASESTNTTEGVDAGSYRHVRIDNFQRPLNQKALIEWIEVQSQCKLLPESLWINAIKTHCYVDFRNEEEAQRCITKVTGQRYPATSAYTLVVDFTSVSAREAPTAEEAAKRPGEWKVVPGQVKAAAVTGGKGTPGKQGVTVTIGNASSAGEEMEGQEATGAHAQRSPAAGAAGTKRRLEEAEDGAASPVASPTAGSAAVSSTAGESGSKARKLAGGMDIFRRATAGILLGRPGASAGTKLGNVGVQPGQPSASTPSVTGLVSRNRRFDQEDGDGQEGDDAREQDSSAGADRGKGLDELFRKTVTAMPALYWLPAPDEVVQQRLKSKLKMKATNNAKK